MVKMAIYTQKYEQKWLKINNGGGIGIEMSWVEKNRKINNRGEGTIDGTREQSLESLLEGIGG